MFFFGNEKEADMSKTDPVTENPNEKQASGKPLGPDEVAPTDSNDLDDYGLGPVNEDEDQSGLPIEASGKQGIVEAGMRS